MMQQQQQQLPQQQQPPMAVFNNPDQAMMMQQPMGGAAMPPNEWYGQSNDFSNGNFNGGGYNGGAAPMYPQMPMAPMNNAPPYGRGRGRGRGGYGFDPMAMNGGFQPMGQRGYGRGGMMHRGGRGMMGYQSKSTVYLSVTTMPVTESLNSIFVLMEAFGGVVSIRRNHNKKEILTVKAASPEDADAIVTYLRQVPYAGGAASAKHFPSYIERHPCTDEGDPTDPETLHFDFTASRHRSPGQRSKAAPSCVLKITGCPAYEETEVMTFLNGKGYFPERITKSEDGSFTVQLADVATAVKALVECHGCVCDEERSNVIFVDGPRGVDAPAEAAKIENEQA